MLTRRCFMLTRRCLMLTRRCFMLTRRCLMLTRRWVTRTWASNMLHLPDLSGGGVYGVTLLGRLTTSSTWVTRTWASTWVTRTWG
jgi:hypothetical protein